ncbi:MAG: thymidylate kinase [Methanobacteriaceae archaeon]|jgi:dTMP kinase|nr:thymidylate kinase [Candidatus Methanorudis spinitermitis]
MEKFIVIDGFDGSGKDTQSQFVFEMYKNIASKNSEISSEKVVLRSHPENDNYFGCKSHKALLKRGKTSKIIATIFFGLDVIRSLILYYHKSDVLIFSRYLLTPTYFPKKLVKPVYGFFSFILPISDFMFYLNLPPEIAMERITRRNVDESQKLQTFENLESLKECREKVSLIISDWIEIDGSKDKNEIRKEIENILLKNN